MELHCNLKNKGPVYYLVFYPLPSCQSNILTKDILSTDNLTKTQNKCLIYFTQKSIWMCLWYSLWAIGLPKYKVSIKRISIAKSGLHFSWQYYETLHIHMPFFDKINSDAYTMRFEFSVCSILFLCQWILSPPIWSAVQVSTALSFVDWTLN